MTIRFDGAIPIPRMTGLAASHAEPTDKACRHERPCLHDQTWSWRAMMVGAPFGHTPVFSERIAECD